jgi:PAS domain S-box-containing protein
MRLRRPPSMEMDEDVRLRLEAADETLRALRAGEADAMVVQTADGEKVFTLRGADRTYRMLVETMPAGAATLSEAGDLLYANQYLSDLLAVPLPQLFGVSFLRFVVPAHSDAYSAARLGAASGSASCEVDLTRGDGSTVSVKIAFATLPPSEPAGMAAIITDLTEDRRRKEEERMLDGIARAFSAADSVSEALRAVLGHVCAELRWPEGQAWFCGPEAEELVLAAAEGSATQAAMSGVATRAAATAAFRSGEIEWTSHQLPSPIGQRASVAIPVIVGDEVVCVLTFDATEQSRSEAELHGRHVALAVRELGSLIQRMRAEAQFHSAFDDAPFGSALISLGPDLGRFARVNHALVEATGYSEAELLRKCLPEVLHPDYRAECERKLRALRIGATQTSKTEARLLGCDGSEGWFVLSVSAVSESAQLTHGVAQFVDIDAHKALEEALREAHRQASEVSGLKSAFVANMSHEIRTPLNGVAGLAELLARTELSERQGAYVSAIRSSSEALMSVIGDILDFSKIEVGKLSLDAADFGPAEILAQASEVLSASAQRKGLVLNTSVDARVPGVARADAGRIRQVLINLIGNAVKFTDTGEVTVQLTVVDGDRPQLRFDVCDTGPGFDADARPFEPFWQADSSLTRRHSGTGLGLPIVKELVELMGGEIGIESVPGTGTQIWFTAPYESASAAVDRFVDSTASDNADHEAPVPPPSADPHTAGRLLLVEDDAVNQLYAISLLEDEGWHVDLAENGREAVARASEGRYDVILMDCQMPVLDGYGAAREIRGIEGTARHTPIIALTAHASALDREQCVAAGMDAYVAKPFSVATLEAALGRALAPDASGLDTPVSADPGPNEEAPPVLDPSRLALVPEPVAEELTRAFVRLSGERIAGLDAAEATADSATAQKLVHALKGSSATIGAVRLSKASAELEAAIACGRVEEIAARQRDLKEAYELTEAALRNVRQGGTDVADSRESEA